MSATRRPGGRGAGLAAAARRLAAAARAAFGSARLRHAPFALFVAGLLAYGAAFAWHLLDRFDLVNLIRDVNRDDAFYYFQIAYHLAGGEFSTFDGGLTRTNGYHPLWLLLVTPFYWFFDKTEALFAIKAFEVMLVAGGVALVAGGGAGGAAAVDPPVRGAAGALRESGPVPGDGGGRGSVPAGAVPAGRLSLRAEPGALGVGRWRPWPSRCRGCAWSTRPCRWRRRRRSGSSSGRTGFRLPGGGGGGGFMVRNFPRALPGSRADGGDGVARRSLNAAAPLSGAVAGILAYFAWNAVVFGDPVPVSGATRQLMSQRYWERTGGYSLTENVDAFLRSGFFDDELLIALEVCVYAALVWWFSRRSRGRDDWLAAGLSGGGVRPGGGPSGPSSHRACSRCIPRGGNIAGISFRHI